MEHNIANVKEILKLISKDYYGVNFYDEQELTAVEQVIKNKSPFRYYGNHLTYETKKFEDTCAKYFDVKFAHAVNSATGGLSCALHALDIGIGDEVIVPGYFWISIINVCLLHGAIPVLCEIDESLNMDPNDLEQKISTRTKGVIVAHMDGEPAQIDKIREICRRNHLKLIEDFSQCIGGQVGMKKVGAYGDISVASMQINKLITAGEGGLVLTNSELLYKKIMARADFGIPRLEDDNEEVQLLTFGEGRRCSELAAAVLNSQIKKIPKILEEQWRTKEYIQHELKNIAPIKYRKVNEGAVGIATTLFLIFPSKQDTDRFMKIKEATFPLNEINIYRLHEFGYHVYYRCSNLVNKVEALPGGFPWKWVDEKKYHYTKGTLSMTDSILERTVGLKLPAKLSDAQKEAIAFGLNYLIAFFLKDNKFPINIY